MRVWEWAQRERSLLVALLALAAVLAALRAHTYGEALERDITTYAVIAHELLQGRQLYTDLWDHKPPILHATFAAAEIFSSYGPASIYLLNVGFGVIVLLGCYRAAASASGSRSAGLLAAAIWTLASGDLWLEGNQPNTELFLNGFLTFAFALMVSRHAHPPGWRRFFAVGALFAIASLYKQIVVIHAVLMGITWCLLSFPRRPGRFLLGLIVIGSAGLLAWIFIFGYFAITGRLAPFIEAVFTYNRAYSGNILHNIQQAWRAELPLGALLLLGLLGAFSLLGLVAAFIRREFRSGLLLLSWAGSTYLAVAATGKFFPHYFQLWLPLLAIGAALAVAGLPGRGKFPVGPRHLATAGLLVALLFLEAPLYRLPAREWSRLKYGNIFNEARDLARQLDASLPEDAFLYEWGNETGFYFETRRTPPSGVIFNYPVLLGPLIRPLTGRLLRELQRARPEVIILEAKARAFTPPDHPFVLWCNAHYRFIRATPEGHFVVLARKGGKLDQAPVSAPAVP